VSQAKFGDKKLREIVTLALHYLQLPKYEQPHGEGQGLTPKAYHQQTKSSVLVGDCNQR
jgi:hypothetical protein